MSARARRILPAALAFVLASGVGPPPALAQTTTGAHPIHLSGSDLAGPYTCSACHVGRVSPAVPAYDPGSATCATPCHGTDRRSPPWTATSIACDGCHDVPPATPIHAGISAADLGGACNPCHPATITPAGTIDVAGGKHVDLTVEHLVAHADGFGQPTLHGPQYLDDVAGVPGALRCRSCHGPTLGYCDSCHSQPANGGWSAWESNCTFCHGTPVPSYSDADLALGSPPGAASQRLTGSPAPARTGKHRVHLQGKAGYGGYPCATCHTVPASVSHVRADRRAPVAIDAAAAFPGLSAAELAALPSPLAVYDTTSDPPRCGSNYCHGATLAGGSPTALQSPPRWSSAGAAINGCAVCHGLPPDTGKLLAADGVACATPCSNHVFHVQALTSGCDGCHHGGAPVNDAGVHVNGRVDVVWPDGTTGTWDPVAGTCAVSCHANPLPRPWR
jgi:predicted CxxxxCH...CXXCH cytochrome family protein